MMDGLCTKRKRPWGAGVFGRLANLGVVGSSKYSHGAFGGLVKGRVNSQNPYRTIEAFVLVTATGLPALITRAVCV
jgi:hypothetical protein